jgi:hypothetical protein
MDRRVTPPSTGARGSVLLSLAVVLHCARLACGGATDAVLAMPERTIREVWRKMDLVDAALYLRANPILCHAFDAGFAEPVFESMGGGCSLGMDLIRKSEERWRAETILARRVVNGKHLEVVLDRLDFPELYVLKDESVRLRTIVEAFEKRGTGPPGWTH